MYDRMYSRLEGPHAFYDTKAIHGRPELCLHLATVRKCEDIKSTIQPDIKMLSAFEPSNFTHIKMSETISFILSLTRKKFIN